jgi:hypothetical protein
VGYVNRDVLVTVIALAILVVAGVHARRPTLAARPGRRRLPIGGYALWSAATLLGAAVFAAATGVRLLASGEGDGFLGTVNLTVVTSAVSALAAVGALYGLFRLRLVYLARRPGPVDIPLLEDATVRQDAPVREATLELRRNLADVELYPQSLIPGNASPQEFVGLVQSATAGKGRGVLNVLAGLLTLIPTHAYRVHAALLRREGDLSYGVSVQLQLRPRWMAAPHMFWGRDWESCLQQAAYAVAQDILPWTRRALQSPWAAWADTQLPHGVFENYQRAKRYVDARRYDEALGAYKRALDADPHNLHMRLEVAGVYQKLALWLDALVLYKNVQELADPRSTVWGSAWRRHERAVGRSTVEAYLFARYRYTIALGWGSQLAHQWSKTLGRPELPGQDGHSRHRSAGERDAQRTAKRELLEEHVLEQAQRLTSADGARRTHPTRAGNARKLDPDRLRGFLAGGSTAATANGATGSRGESPHPTETTLRLLFQMLAYQEAQDIRRLIGQGLVRSALGKAGRQLPDPRGKGGNRLPDAPIRLTARRWRRQVGLTDQSWGSITHWTAWLLAQARQDAKSASTDDETVRTVWHALSAICRDNWATELADFNGGNASQNVNNLAEKVEADLTPGDLTEWLDHYNAACALAAPLLSAGSDEADWGPAAAEAAVSRLERATRMLSADQLSRYSSWLGIEDPDLRGLRLQPAFRRFVAKHLMERVPATTRPDNAHLFELALHTRQMVRRSAHRFADQWLVRGERPEPAFTELLIIWREELEAWRAVRAMTVDHQHWPTRLRLIGLMNDWCARYGVEPPDWAQPDYAETEDKLDERSVKEWVEDSDCQFAAIDRLLRREDGLVPALEAWKAHLIRLDAAGTRIGSWGWHDLCRIQRALWRLVEDKLFTAPPSGGEAQSCSEVDPDLQADVFRLIEQATRLREQPRSARANGGVTRAALADGDGRGPRPSADRRRTDSPSDRTPAVPSAGPRRGSRTT